MGQRTGRVPLIREIGSVASGARVESTPEGTALQTLLQAWNVYMLREASILKFLFKFIVVDMVAVLPANEDQQIIVTIFVASAHQVSGHLCDNADQ
jgi:hypothetical protein